MRSVPIFDVFGTTRKYLFYINLLIIITMSIRFLYNFVSLVYI